MIETRILNNTIPSDVLQFSEIVDEYAKFQRDKPNSLYFYEDMHEYTVWLKNQFIHLDTKDFIVAGLFEDNKLMQIIVGYKIEVAWHKPIVEDTTPYYVIGLMYFRNVSWRLPGENIDSLGEYISNHFEKQGYTTGFLTVKAPNFVIKNTNGVAITKYINEVFTKTFYANTHNYYVEVVCRTPADLLAYKFRAFKALLPKRIKRPVILLSFKLKPEFTTI